MAKQHAELVAAIKAIEAAAREVEKRVGTPPGWRRGDGAFVGTRGPETSSFGYVELLSREDIEFCLWLDYGAGRSEDPMEGAAFSVHGVAANALRRLAKREHVRTKQYGGHHRDRKDAYAGEPIIEVEHSELVHLTRYVLPGPHNVGELAGVFSRFFEAWAPKIEMLSSRDPTVSPQRWLWVASEKQAIRTWKPGARFTEWTCAKNTRLGDLAVLYIRGLKQLIWLGEVVSNPTRRLKSGTNRAEYLCEVEIVSTLEPPVTLAALKTYKAFRNWGSYRNHLNGTAFSVPALVWKAIDRAAGGQLDNRRARSATQAEYEEGHRRETLVNRVERNPALVAEAKLRQGVRCKVCDFEFGETYGPLGDGFIEMHHKKSIAKSGPRANTWRDLIPLCPNCHRMVHRGKKMRTVAQLKKQMAAARLAGKKP